MASLSRSLELSIAITISIDYAQLLATNFVAYFSAAAVKNVDKNVQLKLCYCAARNVGGNTVGAWQKV